MSAAALATVVRARAAVGTRFRLHGRAIGDGLDCVGLVALAYGVAAPRGYALRTGGIAKVVRAIEAAGFERVEDAAAGDLLLMRTGPGQLHLAIATERGFVHADACLRRVVERPGEPPWPMAGRWRPQEA